MSHPCSNYVCALASSVKTCCFIVLYFPAPPSIRALSYSTSNSTAMTLVCQTQGSPPSNITWYRDGTPLDINGNTTDMTVNVTNRTSSYFEVTLNICDSPDAIAGRYICEVENNLGHDSEYYTVQGIDYGQIEYSH